MSERKLVTVRTIGEITPIENADAIECVSIDGWDVVVKKGEFQQGDSCVYFEIDSWLPADDERYEFLAARGTKKDPSGEERVRLKSVRLRGQISQGLALPVSLFPELEYATWEEDGEYVDFSEKLRVIKYERPEPSQANAAGSFPEFIEKTSEPRVQNVFGRLKSNYPNTEFVPTLKLDGSSCTVAACSPMIPGYEFAELEEGEQPKAVKVFGWDVIVCSRNLQLKVDQENHFWSAVVRQDIDTLAAVISNHLHRPIAIQGEVCGPGICGNKENLNKFEFYAFNIYDILNKRYLPFQEANELFNEFNIKTVPVLDEPFKVFEHFDSVKDILEYADGPSMNAKLREGIVFKSIGFEDPVSFKAISNKWLLKFRE